MPFTQAINELSELSDGLHLHPDKIEYWLLKHDELYNMAKNTHTCASYTLPCFCWNRKRDCLFVELYKKLEITAQMVRDNDHYKSQIEDFYKNTTPEFKIKWLQRNLQAERISLPSPTAENKYRDIDITCMNGKKDDQYLHLNFLLDGNLLKDTYDYQSLYDQLFFVEKILPAEYKLWKARVGYEDMVP